MSSILKALRKAEEKEPRATGTESWSHEFDTAQALRKQARRSRGVRTGFVVLLGIALVAVGGWFLYDQRSVIGRFVSRSSATSPGVGPQDRQAKASSPADEDPQGPGRSTKAQARARALSEPAAGKPASTKPSLDKPRPVVEKAAVHVPSPPVEPEPAPLQVQEPTPVQEARTRAMDLANYRLEAIVWSSNPGSRFAVINGQIVRAGGDLDGLSVTAIERDGVKVRSDEGTGELRFTLE